MDANLAFGPRAWVLPIAWGELAVITVGELYRWLADKPANSQVYVECDGVSLVCGDDYIDVGKEEEDNR